MALKSASEPSLERVEVIDSWSNVFVLLCVRKSTDLLVARVELCTWLPFPHITDEVEEEALPEFRFYRINGKKNTQPGRDR